MACESPTQAVIEGLAEHRVITIKHGKLKFHSLFLVRISDEIVRILYANIGDPAVMNDLRTNRAKLIRLATSNIISDLCKDNLSFDFTAESLRLLDMMILQAFPE